MQALNFKKITYAFAAIIVLLTAYLAFVRELPVGDSASQRNAKFLGIKSNAVQGNDISNQKDLSIDGQSNTDPTESEKSTNPATTTETSLDKNSSFYTVKEGDTYGCIAEKYYGSYEHWTDILRANEKYGVGFSEHQLHVGAVLEMPVIPASSMKPASNLCS